MTNDIAETARAREVLAAILRESDMESQAVDCINGLDDPTIPLGEAVEAMLAFATQSPASLEREALRDAYLQGALDVHSHVKEHGIPNGDPEFYEAASDYADAALDPFDSSARAALTTPPSDHIASPSGEVTLREAARDLLRAMHDGQQHVGYRLDLWNCLEACLATHSPAQAIASPSGEAVSAVNAASYRALIEQAGLIPQAATPSPAQQSGELRVAIEIAREAIARKKDADDAPNTARLTRSGQYDDSSEVQDALRGAVLALASTPSSSPSEMGREAIYRTALENILNPLAMIQREAAASGNQLSGAAYSIANDLGFVQSIARTALSKPTELGDR